MQKRRLQSTLNKSGPEAYRYVLYPTRSFYTSLPRAQEEIKEGTDRAVSSSCPSIEKHTDNSFDIVPRPSQRERQHNVTNEVTYSFQQRYGPTSKSHSTRGDFYFRRLNSNAVDARDLAAQPDGPSSPPQQSSQDKRPMKSQQDVGARSIDVQIPNNGFTITRRGQDPKFQTRSTNSAPRRLTRPSSGPQRSGPKRSGRPSFKSNNYADKNDSLSNAKAAPSDAELAYLRTRPATRGHDFSDVFDGGATQYSNAAITQAPYTPAEISLETLRGMGPAIACGERGMEETVLERLGLIAKNQDEYDARVEDLAQKKADGKYVLCRSKAERDHVDALVKRNLVGEGDNAALDDEKEREQMAVVESRMQEEAQKLATRLLKGDYRIGPLGKGPTAELLERYTRRNETYLPQDSKALANKVRAMLPVDRPLARDGNKGIA